jgi:hypothetical protein
VKFVRAFVPENLCTCIPVPKTSVPTYQALHSKIPLASDSGGMSNSNRRQGCISRPCLHLACRMIRACISYRVRLLFFCMRCPIHNIELICYCPACRGSATSKSKAQASRENGKLGGRPKGSKSKPKPKTANKGRR